MDCAEDVVRNSDTTLSEKQRSAFFDAYLNGRKLSGNLSGDDFAAFIQYSALIAGCGAREMFGGNIASEITLGEAVACGILNTPKYVLSVYSYRIRNIRKRNVD